MRHKRPGQPGPDSRRFGKPNVYRKKTYTLQASAAGFDEKQPDPDYAAKCLVAFFLLSSRRSRREPRRISARDSRFDSNPSIDRWQIGLGSIIELGSKSSRAPEDWVCPRSTPRCSGVFCGNNDWFNPIAVHSHRRSEFFSAPFGLRRLNQAKALRKLWERIAEALTPSPVRCFRRC